MKFHYLSHEKVLFTEHAVREDFLDSRLFVYDAVKVSGSDQVKVLAHNSIEVLQEFGGTIISYKPIPGNTTISTKPTCPFDRIMGVEDYISNYVENMDLLLLNDKELSEPLAFSAKMEAIKNLLSKHYDRSIDSISIRYIDYSKYKDETLTDRQNRLIMISDLAKYMTTVTHVVTVPGSTIDPTINFIISSACIPNIDWSEVTSSLGDDERSKESYQILFHGMKIYEPSPFISPTYRFDENGEFRPIL